MRITSKGQVTIPQDIREKAGFLPGTELDFVIDDAGTVRVCRSAEQPQDAGLKTAIGRLWGAADTGLSTEEIMALTRR